MDVSMDNLNKWRSASGSGRQGATSGTVNRDGAGRIFHSKSNGSASSGGCAMRKDRSADRRQCRFDPYSKGDAHGSQTHGPYEIQNIQQMREHVSTPGDYNIRITNLHYGVRDTDLKDLFGKFGPLKSVTVYYDRYGRTLETADVVFHSNNAALKAVFQYNNAQFYGRPMNLEITTVSSTVANHAITFPDRVIHFGDDHGIQGNRVSTTEVRGYSIRSGGNGQRRKKRKIPSKEELDAQLDCIMSNRNKC